MTTPSEQLINAFEARSLDPARFHHADHVAVAYEMLTRYDFIEAISRYAGNIHQIAKAAGAPEKFNATITLAFLSLIAERMATSRHASYREFIQHNPDLNGKAALNQWYSPDRLASALARTTFLMPDKTLAPPPA